MKKRFWNGKRLLSLLLAFTLVMGQTGFVSAETVSDNSVERQTSISANSTENVFPEKAYNGTPSKVIGLEGKYTEGSGVQLIWESLTTENKISTSDGKLILIGYEVEENGKIIEGIYESADGKYQIRNNAYYYTKLNLAVGDTVKYRVRGLYYTLNEDVTPEKRDVIGVGEWSDYYVYKVPELKDVPLVTGLTGTTYKDPNGKKYVRFKWNPVAEVSYYNVQIMYSDVKLTGLTSDTWTQFWNESGSAYDAFDAANPNASMEKTSSSWSSSAYYSLSYQSTYRYYYARVKANTNVDGYKPSEKYCAIATCDAGVFGAETSAVVEQIKDFKVEYSANGETFDLTWTPTKASMNMIIYAYESPSFPKHYYYSILNAKGKKAGSNGTYYYSNNMDPMLKATIDNKVHSLTTNADRGSVSANFNLEYGKTYYFVAHTYSSAKQNEERTPIFTVDGISYTKYRDISAASAIVSAKKKLPMPSVYAQAGKKAITLHMEYESGHTGYEIYRKNGKKYKKIATTTDSFYTDSDVKAGKKYQYKVRAYNYNKNTKKKVYSAYKFVTGETADVKSIDLVVKHKTKKKLSLKWTKVAGAYKYEVYRTSYDNGNPKEYTKTNSAGKVTSSWAMDDTYELIKTFHKASATSYVDKNVIPGESYEYCVVAYYKAGKTINYVSASDSISMMLSSPDVTRSLKGTTAKYSWNKNKYASGYEVRYLVYDSNGVAVGDWKTVKTTKSYFSVTLPVGGKVTASVRAYNKSGCYSSWTSSSYIYTGLAVPTNIKAKNVVVKNGSGESVNAVKVTWKPVSGAKYYKVYRGTKADVYDKDTKRYHVNDATTDYIAKESNDDETYDEITYDQYYGVNGSIVGTTAYDYAQLDVGVNYYYYVVAFGEKGTNIFSTYTYASSANGSGKPACVTYKGTLKINKITNKKKGRAVLKWTKFTGAKKYYVYRSEKKKGGYKLIATTKKATYTDKKVKKGKTYYYKIVAEGTNPLKADFMITSSVKKIKIKK